VAGEPVYNANGATFYVPVNAAGKEITVSVTAAGYEGAVTSNAITAVANPAAFKSMAGMLGASKTQGRVFTDPDKPTAVRIEWPACGFEFNVNAEGGNMKVHYETSYESTLAVFVDGVKLERPTLMPVANGHYFEIPLTAGQHTIKLLRELEPSTYVGQKQMLLGIEFAGTVEAAPAKNDLYIEFIGDSTVTGSGSAGEFRPGQGFLVTDHSNTSSFAYQVAQDFSADYSIVAKGNCGFCSGDVAQKISMTDAYEYLWRWSGEEKYTFSRTPDVIVMKIGGNDTVSAGFSLELFKEGAKNFILRLREIYGEEPAIVWFDRTSTGGYTKEQYDAMVALQKELGDKKFFVTSFTWDLEGAGPATVQIGLPSAQNHRDLADQVTAYLKNTVGIGK
ncbi:MAG: hypothetical protein IKU57_04840, partial [Oscillospiraceae bacterium]|nr:hypothetical protein [Oscillospiraceae bacterium]